MMMARNLQSISLGKLLGFHYPPAEEENKLLYHYFHKCNRQLSTSKYVYIHRFKRLSNHDYHRHHCRTLEVYPYVVTKLEVLWNSSDSSSISKQNNNHRDESNKNITYEIEEGISVKGSTSLLLDGLWYTSQHSYGQHVAEAVRIMTTSGDYDLADLPDIIQLRIVPSICSASGDRFFSLKLHQTPSGEDIFKRHDTAPTTPITGSTGTSPQKLQYHSSTMATCTDNFHSFINQQIGEYLRQSLLLASTVNPSTLPITLRSISQWTQDLYRCISMRFQDEYLPRPMRSQLSKDHIFLDLDTDIQEEEICKSILACCNDLIVPVIFLDARCLLIQATAATQASLLDSVHIKSNEPNMYHPTSLSEYQQLRTIIERAVVVLDHVDSVLYYDIHPQQYHAETRSSNNETSRQRKLFDTIETLLTGASDQSRKSQTLEYESNGRHKLPLHCVVAFSKNSRMLLPSTKLLFTTFIRCSARCEGELQANSNNSFDPNSNCQIQWEHSSLRLLQNAAVSKEEFHSRRINMKLLSNQSLLEAFKRQHSPYWLECFGYQYNAIEINSMNMKKNQVTVHRRDCKNAYRISQQQQRLEYGLVSAHSTSEDTKTSSNIVPVHWKDIGGMERVRKEILDVLELPLKYPHLFPHGSPRRHGVLLYGPPGTGKTLIAKAVATECKMSFLSIKGPELLDSYVGESERNVREIFSKARGKSPCILFFDEIDSLAPRRAKGTDSGGGVMDRIVSQLLTEMDQLGDSSKSADGKDLGVFVIAATNRPDLLDPALLRPGRFDRRIYLGASNSVEARLQILKAQTRKFVIEESVDLQRIAALLPDNVTGADIGAVSSSAYSKALERKLMQVHERFHANKRNKIRYGSDREDESDEDDLWAIEGYMDSLSKKDISVEVSLDDFKCAITILKPSVVDLSHYDKLEKQFDSGINKSH